MFGIEQEALLATGMPRLDHFLDEERQAAAEQRLMAKYPWMGDGRVIVFAPTFRGAGQATAYYPYDSYIDCRRFGRCASAPTHTSSSRCTTSSRSAPEIPSAFANRLKDLSDESLGDLLYVADVLVTDYSSCFYDCLLLQKPVVFYVPTRWSTRLRVACSARWTIWRRGWCATRPKSSWTC